ncbi:MAG TPA: DUF3300 domain-containing protein [Rhizomicrobium sp.]|nr:DUF3300 domain-containing protein [Rhizomicrobium sp.]
MKRILAGVAILAASLLASSALYPALAQAQTQAPATAAAPAAPPLSAGELDAMMAPVALYSDQLLAKVCIAATYPLEVVEAERWVAKHPDLKGDALDAALAKETWDQSIKDLVRVPTVLKMMSDRIDWTRKLGDAFLSHQADVLASVQRLRAQAQNTGALKSTPEQTVSTEDNAIVIEPVQPEVAYVPYYESSVYGDWAYPSYPPYYWPPPAGYGVAAGIGFIAGIGIAAGWWNNGVNWGGGSLYVNHFNNFNNFNNYNFNRNNGQVWNHRVEHRKGVGYGNEGLRQQYGNRRTGSEARQNFKGFGSGGRHNTGGNLGNRGNHVAHQAGNGNRGNYGGLGNRGQGNLGQGSRGGLSNRGGASHFGQSGRRGSYGGMSGGHRGGGRMGGGHRGGGRGGGGRRR